MKTGYVYILTNRSRRFYIGVTSNLKQRLYQHKAGLIEGFSKAYKLDRLAYFEVFPDMTSAIAREKQLKGWLCTKRTRRPFGIEEKASTACHPELVEGSVRMPFVFAAN